MVSRSRLHERIAEGLDGRLTLVAAPAGFGKTTLLAQWAATARATTDVAWVSLDPIDNDPAVFWSYVLAALLKVRPHLGERSRALLNSFQPPPIATLLTPLINEISDTEGPLVLVLDDFHVINAQTVHDGIVFLLAHMPPSLHLVLGTRTDPPLPLPRLRARRELTEIRSADLRFTSEEATSFLKRVMGLDLSSTQMAALEQQTEGWIAGLQLAALSMQGHGDISSFTSGFSGDNRHIADYLIEEVLQGQPDDVRNFLLDTCILDRLTASLCDAVTGRADGGLMLEQLERRNIFIVPLDDHREWYRYHHLFADVLRARSATDDPDRVGMLHRRASEWCETGGTPGEAVHHALAARDPARAAELIEMAWPAMEGSYQSAVWLGWARELPDEIVRVRPVVTMGYAWALLNAGDLDAGEARLQQVERWLAESAPSAGASVVADELVADEEQLRSLPVSLGTARAYLAQARGNAPDTIRYARRVLDLLPEEAYSLPFVFQLKTCATGLLGLAYWASGDLEAAHSTVAGSMAELEKGGDSLSAIGMSFVLGDIRVAQGRLSAAATIYDRSLQRAAEQPTMVFPGLEELHLGVSEVQRERNDLATARQHLATARELVQSASWPSTRYRWCISMARVSEACGDVEGALRLLDEAKRAYVRGPLPDLRPAGAFKATLLIRQGRLAEAMAWASDSGLAADNDLVYTREFEHITLARLLVARGVIDRDKRLAGEGISLLDRLLEVAEKEARTGSVLEILVARALAHYTQAEIPEALRALERALTLAQPEEYVRLFVDEGGAMRELLGQAVAAGIVGLYRRRLLSAFDDCASNGAFTAEAALLRPLTPRELEIVRLLAGGLRNHEIADQLFISPSTVKRHIANAYDKLGVAHRVSAVARANELSLL